MGLDEVFTVNEKVIKPDNRNADGVAPVGFAKERVGLKPETAKVGPENRGK
jgi:hypothetical protein